MDTTRLPDKYLETGRIKDMEIGDSGYAVPWALSVNLRREVFLNPNYTIEPDAGGTLTMRVSRGLGGYVVDITRVDRFRWTPDADAEGLPVVRLIT
jgi:hypothetical protein